MSYILEEEAHQALPVILSKFSSKELANFAKVLQIELPRTSKQGGIEAIISPFLEPICKFEFPNQPHTNLTDILKNMPSLHSVCGL